MTTTDTRPDPDPAGSIQTARQNRRRRTIYASLAGWTLLGAASVGLVACTSSAAATGTTSAAASPSAATSAASSAVKSSSSASSASSAATTSSAATSAAVSEAAATTADSSTAAATTTAAASSTYKDGTYTATGSYNSPGGTEEITVTLTLADDKITAATATGGATQPPASQYQGQFISNFAALIIGKDVADVTLDKVAGSSLTSGGFNEAVDTIKSEAQA